MKLTVLVENHVSGAGLRGEHGLSLCLELSGRRVMLDTGQSPLFADNARRLGFCQGAIWCRRLLSLHGSCRHPVTMLNTVLLAACFTAGGSAS